MKEEKKIELNTIDYNFYYRNIVRNILLHKVNGNKIKNTYEIPYFSKMTLYFHLLKIENFKKVEIYNYLYLYKFFFGKSGFISKYKTYLESGNYSYSFSVLLVLNNKRVYQSLFLLFNDLFIFSNKSYLKFKRNKEFITFIFSDINIFSEKKDNLGLFNLKSNLHIQVCIKGLDSKKLILKALKIKV
jgi:hypothetical protein